MDPRGAYSAKRAAALSGVPWSTVHEWARKGVLVPSVSAERLKLWSYADLMGLRVIYWLRHTKETPHGDDIPAASMRTVRKALAGLRDLDFALWTEDGGPRVAVDRKGRVILDPPTGHAETVAEHQTIADLDLIDVTRPFPAKQGLKGPDLERPRPHLRIVPGRLAGSPHVERTRLETRALAALSRRGMGTGKIARLYPIVSASAVNEAIDLERQLAQNSQVAV